MLIYLLWHSRPRGAYYSARCVVVVAEASGHGYLYGFIFKASGTQAAATVAQLDLYTVFIPEQYVHNSLFAVAFASARCILQCSVRRYRCGHRENKKRNNVIFIASGTQAATTVAPYNLYLAFIQVFCGQTYLVGVTFASACSFLSACGRSLHQIA